MSQVVHSCPSVVAEQECVQPDITTERTMARGYVCQASLTGKQVNKNWPVTQNSK